MSRMKVADEIANFLKEQEIQHVFGIIGAGNAHIYDAISRLGYTEIICVHHEQAAVMAAQTYYKISGKITLVLLTTGGGSTNAITGVVGAWMDSTPVLILSGNENSKFTSSENKLRIWGVQGYDSSEMVNKVTKYSKRVCEPLNVVIELNKAYQICGKDRPGPCWLDVPMDIQSTLIMSEEKFSEEEFSYEKDTTKNPRIISDLNLAVDLVANKIKNSKRPLVWLGNGIRLSGAEPLVEQFIEILNCPVLVSWSAIDLIDSNHPLVFGRAGVYGQRAANFILQNCDFLLTVGTRLAIPQVGYDISEFARDAEVAMVDIDALELEKYPEKIDFPINLDAKNFIAAMIAKFSVTNKEKSKWINKCNEYRAQYPFVGLEHADKNGFINSYRFIDKLNNYLKPKQIIVTDMGTALLCGHQALKIHKNQRLMTSQGLGEMGFGLPGAIGASFGANKAEVLCLNCDGGMMMNLQELQTIAHHQLPIKIIIFNNDGYLMIKHTQKSIFEGRRVGTNFKTGVSCPNYSALAKVFGFLNFRIKTWQDFDEIIPQVLAADCPVICEVFMDPEQLFSPKLSLTAQADGKLVSPPLEDLSPLLSREELEKNMLIGMHEKSKQLKVD